MSSKGWSQRSAAPKLGVTYEHLNRVLMGHRESRRLLRAILEMPEKGKEAQP